MSTILLKSTEDSSGPSIAIRMSLARLVSLMVFLSRDFNHSNLYLTLQAVYRCRWYHNYSSGQNKVNVPFPCNGAGVSVSCTFLLRFHTVSAFSRKTHVSV